MDRCKECGLVALRSRDDDKFHEVNKHIRNTGKFDVPKNVDKFHHGAYCFVMAHDLQSESGYSEGRTKEDQERNLYACLDKERTCRRFTAWQQGFTPKEHVAMIREERLLELQQQREEDDRRWQNERQQADHQWRKEERKLRLWELFVMAVIVTGVSIAGQIAAALVERGTLLKENHGQEVRPAATKPIEKNHADIVR